jgi:hypothetical protein
MKLFKEIFTESEGYIYEISAGFTKGASGDKIPPNIQAEKAFKKNPNKVKDIEILDTHTSNLDSKFWIYFRTNSRKAAEEIADAYDFNFNKYNLKVKKLKNPKSGPASEAEKKTFFRWTEKKERT